MHTGHRLVSPPSQSLRFQRWSRKRAATFHSIKREVTIGCLRANIVERLLLKTNHLPDSHHVSYSEEQLLYQEVLDDPDHLLSDEWLELLVTKPITISSHSSSLEGENGRSTSTSYRWLCLQGALESIDNRYNHRYFLSPSHQATIDHERD